MMDKVQKSHKKTNTRKHLFRTLNRFAVFVVGIVLVGYSLYGIYVLLDEKIYDFTPVELSYYDSGDGLYVGHRTFELEGANTTVNFMIENKSSFDIEIFIMSEFDYDLFVIGSSLGESQNYVVTAENILDEDIDLGPGKWYIVIDNSYFGELTPIHDTQWEYEITLTYKEPRLLHQ